MTSDALTRGSVVDTRALMPTSPAKRRKKIRKELSIQVRVTAAQKVVLVKAAKKVGLGVSTWLLTLGLRESAPKAP
jgi:hypothetical protein